MVKFLLIGWFVVVLLSVVHLAASPVDVIHGGDQEDAMLLRSGGPDTWRAITVIDEGHPFVLEGTETGRGVLHEFAFVVKKRVGRVTPFVARRLADNAFQVRAIGTTRIAGRDYTQADVGKVVRFPFSDTPEMLRVDDGWVAGFISANPDGTSTDQHPIPFDFTGNEIWYTGGPELNDHGSIVNRQAPTKGTTLVLDDRRTYAFQVTALSEAEEQEPPCRLDLSSKFFPAATSAGDLVALLIGRDRNIGDQLAYKLVAGEGDTDNASFLVEGPALRSSEDLGSDERDYHIRIRVTDTAGGELVVPLILSARQRQAPSSVILETREIPLGVRSGERLGSLRAVDANSQDLRDDHIFTLLPSLHQRLFRVIGDDLYWFSGMPRLGLGYEIEVQATDRFGLHHRETIVLRSQALGQAFIGNEVTGRRTSRSDSEPALYFNYAPMPAPGVVDGVQVYFQGQRRDQTFRILHLREVVPGEFDVLYDSGEISPEGLQDEAVVLPFPNGPTEVRGGDQFAHHGRGIPLNIAGAVADDGQNFVPVYQAAIAPMVGQRIVVASLPPTESSVALRDYAWAVSFRPTLPLAPYKLTITGEVISLDAMPGMVVASLLAEDHNPGESFTYQLVEGDGDTDNHRFQVMGAALVLGESPVVSEGCWGVRVRVTDQDGLSLEQVHAFRVVPDQRPTAIHLVPPYLFLGAREGEVIGELSASDPNESSQGVPFFSLVEGFGDDDNEYFAIESDQLLAAAVLDEARESYQLRLKVTDTTGLTFERPLSLPVTALLGGDVSRREDSGGDAIGQILYTNFVPVEEPGVAVGVSFHHQGAEGVFSLVQLRKEAERENVYDVIHSSGEIRVAADDPAGWANRRFPSGTTRIEPGDSFGHFGNGLSYTMGPEEEAAYTPIYSPARLRPTRHNIITLGSPAFRFAPWDSRDYSWAVQWLSDSRAALVTDRDGDSLPDAWEQSFFASFDQTAFTDPDGDGLPNRLEWVLGTDSAGFTPVAEWLTLTQDRVEVQSKAGQLEGRVALEWSADLAEWERLLMVPADDAGLFLEAPWPVGRRGFVRLLAH